MVWPITKGCLASGRFILRTQWQPVNEWHLWSQHAAPATLPHNWVDNSGLSANLFPNRKVRVARHSGKAIAGVSQLTSAVIRKLRHRATKPALQPYKGSR